MLKRFLTQSSKYLVLRRFEHRKDFTNKRRLLSNHFVYKTDNTTGKKVSVISLTLFNLKVYEWFKNPSNRIYYLIQSFLHRFWFNFFCSIGMINQNIIIESQKNVHLPTASKIIQSWGMKWFPFLWIFPKTKKISWI